MVRYKKRYIIVEWRHAYKEGHYIELRGKDPEFAVMKAIANNYGEYGVAIVQPIKFQFVAAKLGLLMLQVPIREYLKVLTSIELVSSIGGVACVPKVLTVTGTPLAAHRFLKKYNEKALSEFLASKEHFEREKKKNLEEEDSDESE